MTGGYEPNDDDEPLSRPPGPDRPWQHPSEVGQAVRGRVDRRRSSFLATGLVLSGLGLLVTGVLMGQLPQTAAPAPDPTPSELAAPSLVAVTAVDDDGVSRQSTAIVLDDEGHLLVPAEHLSTHDAIWARVTDDELRRSELVGVDDELGVAVVRVGAGGAGRAGGADTIGTAPRVASANTTETVEVLQRVRKGVTAAPASVAPKAASPVALTAMTVARPGPDELRLRPADGGEIRAGPVFDDEGRLVAVVPESGGPDATGTVSALPARTALGAGAELLDG